MNGGILMDNITKIADKIYHIDVGTPELPSTFSSYLLVGSDIMIIDPGAARFYNNILSALKSLNLSYDDVKYIALTHIHLDHAGAAGYLLDYLPNASVLVHPVGKQHLMDPRRLWDATKNTLGDIANYLGEPKPISENRIITLKDYEIIELGKDLCVLSLFTPGHAKHHVSYFTDETDILFAGDSVGLFMNGFSAPTTPPPFRLNYALESLRKILQIHPKFIGYFHFGPGDNAIKEIMSYYGQLNLWYDILKQNIRIQDSDTKILDSILKFDHLARGFMESVKENWFLKDAVFRSLKGFLDLINKS